MDDYIHHVHSCNYCDYRIWQHCDVAQAIIESIQDPGVKDFFTSGRAEELVKMIDAGIIYFAVNGRPRVGHLENWEDGQFQIRHANTVIKRPSRECFRTLAELKAWLNE